MRMVHDAGVASDVLASRAVGMKKQSKIETGHTYVSTFADGLVASPGGFPLVEGGKLVGAVGCSGGTGDQDASVCKAAADAIK